MPVKLLLTTALAVGVFGGLALAQSGDQATRNPNLGDPVHKTQPAQKPLTQSQRAAKRAQDVVKSDKQPPGTENGNQPDRAAAGGGAR